MRAEIVEAAFRAIDQLGQTERPRDRRRGRHRKTQDLPAFHRQIRPVPGDRGASARHVWAAIFPSIDFAHDSVREIIHRTAEEHVNLVDEHPNVLRFFIQGRFPEHRRPRRER